MYQRSDTNQGPTSAGLAIPRTMPGPSLDHSSEGSKGMNKSRFPVSFFLLFNNQVVIWLVREVHDDASLLQLIAVKLRFKLGDTFRTCPCILNYFAPAIQKFGADEDAGDPVCRGHSGTLTKSSWPAT